MNFAEFPKSIMGKNWSSGLLVTNPIYTTLSALLISPRIHFTFNHSLVPRPRGKEWPGNHCLRMRGSPGFSGELGN